MSDANYNARYILSGASSVTPRFVDQVGQDFRFVEVGGPSKQDEEARSVIRAHVMKDFYGKRRQGKEPNHQAKILSAASSEGVVSQQVRRFKNGPHGLQEQAKKRRRRSAPRKSENLRLQDASYIEASRVAPSKPFTHLPFAQAVEDDVFTLSGNCTSQPVDPSGSQPAHGNAPAIENRDLLIGSDPLAWIPGSGDPFDTLPLPNCPRTQILIYHANNSILASPLMGQLRTEWLSLAIKDLAMFHICLSHYAGNYGLAKQENDPAEALRLRMESMRIVNERLDDHEAALADGTLGTVASLSSYEATNGSLSAVRTHLQGLIKMIRLRGGIQASGMNPYTSRLVLWADLNCSNVLACDPMFPSPDSHATNAHARASRVQRRSSSSASFQGQNIDSMVELQLLNKDLIDKFADLHYLAGINSSSDRRQTIKRDEQIMRSDEVYSTERSLLVLSNLCGPRNFVTSCCVATIIFIDNHLRNIALNARIIGRHVARLKLSMGLFLDQPSTSAAHSATPRTIFWTLYVGGTAAGGRPERDWFVEHLLEFCDLLELSSWEDAEGILKTFLWPISWDFQGILLWECLEDAMVMKSCLKIATGKMANTGPVDLESFSYQDEPASSNALR